MQPVALQIPGREKDEIVFAKDQPEYIPLPALPIITERRRWHGILTRWRLSDEERQQIAASGDIYLQVLTFGQPLQPLMLTTECPVLPTGEPS